MDKLSFKKANMSLVKSLVDLDILMVKEDLVDIYINDKNLLKLILIYELEKNHDLVGFTLYDEFAPFNNEYYYSELWNHNGEKEKKNIYLFCCASCGEYMCWGLSIDIEFTDNEVIWKNWNIHTPNEEFKDFPEFRFDRKEYKKAIDSLKDIEELEMSDDIFLYVCPLDYLKVKIKINDEEFYFSFDEYGDSFEPILKPEIELKGTFKFSYFDQSIEISVENKEMKFGFFKLVKLAKVYTLIHKKYFYLISEKYPELYNVWLLRAVKSHFDDLIYQNFIVEIELGSFNEEIKIFPKEIINKIANEFFKNNKTFSTHLVGFKYNSYRFETPNIESKEIYLMWESDNEHDSNAVIVVDKNAQKLGYLRKTISPFLMGILKEKLFLKGKVIKYINQDNIFLEVYLEEKHSGIHS